MENISDNFRRDLEKMAEHIEAIENKEIKAALNIQFENIINEISIIEKQMIDGNFGIGNNARKILESFFKMYMINNKFIDFKQFIDNKMPLREYQSYFYDTNKKNPSISLKSALKDIKIAGDSASHAPSTKEQQNQNEGTQNIY